MTKPKTTKPASPWLGCPECGEPAVEAHGRGRYDADGNYIEHRDGCRCAWCDWMWFDDRAPVACRCGALVGVVIDDGHAYARDVNNPARMPIPPLPEGER